MNSKMEQVIAIVLLMSASISSFALPIAVDFSGVSENSRVEAEKESNNQGTVLADSTEDSVSKPKFNLLNFSPISRFSYYDQLMVKLLSESGLAEGESVETAAEDVIEAGNIPLSELSEIISEDFQLVEAFIRHTTGSLNRSASLSEDSLNGTVSQMSVQPLNYNKQSYNQSNLNISLDSSDILGSILLDEKRKSDLRKRQQIEQTSFLELLKNLLPTLVSPITLSIILISIILFVLSSRA